MVLAGSVVGTGLSVGAFVGSIVGTGFSPIVPTPLKGVIEFVQSQTYIFTN